MAVAAVAVGSLRRQAACIACASLPALGRALASSAAPREGMPSYTYTPPGSSVSDPSYAAFGGGAVQQQPLGDSKSLKPSKKAMYLRISTKARATPLEPQAAGGMLPPGCSVSDPHYSIKDPIYFMDGAAK